MPLCQGKYDEHKAKVLKLISDDNIIGLKKEVADKTKSIKQLQDLLYELNTLRNQVDENEIKKFDLKSASVYRVIKSLLDGYLELSRISNDVIERTQEEAENEKENSNPFSGAQQIQMLDNINDFKLRQMEERCQRIQTLNDDAEDLNAMYGQLHEMVHGQASAVDDIAEAVESTGNNVDAGLKHLVYTHRSSYKVYPVTCAAVGTMIGGPVGLVAGAKLGALAALCCAVLGYASGNILKETGQNYIETLSSDNDKMKDDANESSEIKKKS